MFKKSDAEIDLQENLDKLHKALRDMESHDLQGTPEHLEKLFEAREASEKLTKTVFDVWLPSGAKK